MARRRRDSKYQSPHLNDPVFLGVVGFAIVLLFVPTIWKVCIALLGIAAVVIKVVVHKRGLETEKLIGIDVVDNMSGVEFEHHLWLLFAHKGYEAVVTPKSGDWGADLKLRKDGVVTVVQAKRYKKNIGIEAVQQVVASRNMYGAREAMVVTNSYYTPAAKTLAARERVQLWDRDRLMTELLQMNKAKS